MTTGTIRTRTAWLRLLGREAGPLLTLGTGELVEWMAAHEGWTLGTRHSVRVSLRAFYGWAVDQGLLAASPAQGLPRVPQARPAPRVADEDAIARARAAGRRDVRLMIRLGAEAGLRRSEIAAVHRDHLVRLPDGPALMVRGKGDRTRLVPVSGSLSAEVKELCRIGGGHAFPGARGGHMTPGHVGVLITRALGGNPHSLRHRYGHVTYAATGDVRVVQDLLGHASLATTQVYVGVDAGRKRAAARAAAA